MKLERPGALTPLAMTLAFVMAPCVWAEEPQHIISLAPSVTETVFALGLGDQLVGVSTYCDYPPEAQRIDRIGTFLTPNIEAIVAKRPDLIIAVPSPGNRNPVESLRRLGLRVLVVDPQSVAEVEESLVVVGRALGRESAGLQLADDVRARMEAVQERLAGTRKRKVLMVVGHSPLVAVGRGTLQDELISMARGINVGAEAGGTWPHLSLEFVIQAAPEVIIDTAMGSEEGVSASAGKVFWEAFSTLPAVGERRIYGYKAYELLRRGPRIAEAFEAIARFIHPEQFG